MEQSLTTTQEELSSRVTELVRHEQAQRKLQTELRTLRERSHSSEDELLEQRSLIDKLRKDVLQSKDEMHRAVQEGVGYKELAQRREVELNGVRDQERLLNEQVRFYVIVI